MLQTYFLAVLAIAGVATLAWLFVEKRVNVTAFIAFITWTMLAVTGGDVDSFENGVREAAPVPAEVRWLLFGLAILSFLALALYQLGVYPPDTGEPYHDSRTR